jgi:PAS domain S-box-containing protein
MNDAYAHILGRPHPADLLGKTVLDALPEMRGHSCVNALNEAFHTGRPKIGVELKRKLQPHPSSPVEEAHFELSYNPLRDPAGTVCGVMVLATDITDIALTRQVSDSRETQLYRHWAELETIYRTAPFAMCFFDATEFRIFRANKLQAETMGALAEELIGKRILDLFPNIRGLPELFARVAAGETITNFEFTTDFPSAPGVFRTWRLNYSPVFDPSGKVEMITSIALEIPSPRA